MLQNWLSGYWNSIELAWLSKRHFHNLIIRYRLWVSWSGCTRRCFMGSLCDPKRNEKPMSVLRLRLYAVIIRLDRHNGHGSRSFRRKKRTTWILLIYKSIKISWRALRRDFTRRTTKWIHALYTLQTEVILQTPKALYVACYRLNSNLGHYVGR